MLLLLLIGSAGCSSGPPHGLIRIDRAEVRFFLHPGDRQPATAPESVSLPHSWTAEQRRDYEAAEYRLTFSVGDIGEEPYGVYTTRMRDGGQIRLDGRLLDVVPFSDSAVRVSWRRGMLVDVAPSLLGGGEHELRFRIVPYAPDPDGRFYPVFVGPAMSLEPLWRQRTYEALFLPQVSVVLTLTGAFMSALIWLRRRRDRVYLLFSLASGFWALRSLYYSVEQIPAWLGPRWLELSNLATAGFVLSMAVFIYRLAGRRWPGLELLYLLYGLFGVILVYAFGLRGDHIVLQCWQAGLLAPALHAVATLARAQYRGETPRNLVFWVGLAIAAVASIHDLEIALDALPRDTLTWLSFAALAPLFAMAISLVHRFTAAMQSHEALASTLEARVSDRERELAANFARLAQAQREQARLHERQRIMQDVHDGMGSQLLSALILVEHGQLDQSQVAAVLRQAIDDMRLSIDVLSGGGNDFESSLGNLIVRIDQRVRPAGIDLQLINELRDRVPVPATAGLQLLRIIQESIGNALKHSGARRITVTARYAPGDPMLEVVVADSGRGFDAAATPRADQHGLANMRSRAQRIGAELRITSGPEGTVCRVLLPVVPPKSSGETAGGWLDTPPAVADEGDR